MHFRNSARIEDKEYIRDILDSSGLFYQHEIKIAIEIVDEYIQKGERSGYCFILIHQQEARPAGFAIYGEIPCTKDRYDLYWIAVHQELRGKGLGKTLIHNVESSVKEKNGEILFIETSSREKYASTRSFYKHCGYQEAAIIPDYYADGDGKVIYSKRLI